MQTFVYITQLLQLYYTRSQFHQHSKSSLCADIIYFAKKVQTYNVITKKAEHQMLVRKKTRVKYCQN
jgi:hypothetical protein